MMSRIPARFSLRPAFTLLELLLVLMLIGINAATIVPHLNGTLCRWQLRETAHNLETTLQLASQWACVRQEAIVFALDTKRGTFHLRPFEGGPSQRGGLLSLGRQSFGQGVAVVRIEGLTDRGNEKVLVFRSDGTSHAARVVLTGARPDANRGTLWEIVVDGYGIVQCQERLANEAGR